MKLQQFLLFSGYVYTVLCPHWRCDLSGGSTKASSGYLQWGDGVFVNRSVAHDWLIVSAVLTQILA